MQDEQEVIPEDPKEEPCGCCNVEPIEGFLWYRSLSVWNYPFRLDSSLWEGANTLNKISDYQISDSILDKLSTDELVDICIRFPFLYMWCGQIQIYSIGDDVNVCMDNIISNFNGFIELFNRDDGVSKMLKRYDELVGNMAAICSGDGEEKFIYGDFKILLGRYQTDKTNAIDIYKDILRHLMDGYNAKLSFHEEFNTYMYLYPNFVARANIISRISPGIISTKPALPDLFGYGPDPYEQNLIDSITYILIK
jgi:hypothetical protein